MRELIDAVNLPRSFNGVLFHGSPEKTFEFDSNAGTIFSNFDMAAASGRFVFECHVSVDRLITLSPEQIGHDAVDSLREVGMSGYMLVDEDTRVLVVFDPKCVEVIRVHDSLCDLELEEQVEDHVLLEYNPTVGSRLLFVTGKLAHSGLERVLKIISDDFEYEIAIIDIAVAAWITTEMISEIVSDVSQYDAVIIPGKTIGDETSLEARWGVPVLRGPACYSELPTFLERKGVEIDPNQIVRPKIVLIGDNRIGKEIAKTYEIPHINLANMLETLGSDDLAIAARKALDEDGRVPHYLMAEIVRSRLVLPDAQKGFVLDGYPETPRDLQWLDEMSKPDCIVAFRNVDLELRETVKSRPAYIDLTESENLLSDAFTRIEGMLQSCVRSSE